MRGADAPFGFEACAGIQGILSFFQLGILFPGLGDSSLFLGVGARLAVFLDAGGGFKSLFGDEGNAYVVASSWLGSGFGSRMGLRFYPVKA